jgi:osmotically inducible protein OsmC
MKRFGSAAWNGGLREGKGSVSTESGALETYPYTFFSRYGEKPGTNPEELLGAAHAACFTMSFVRLLGMANFVPEQVDSKSEVVIDKDGDGFSITSVHLTVTAKIPGIERDAEGQRQRSLRTRSRGSGHVVRGRKTRPRLWVDGRVDR